jgi:uncharacterized damage-inducible protein DinB
MIDSGAAGMLARYNAWANRTLMDAVAALPPDEPTRERQTLFKTMVGTLNHIYTVNEIWRAHLQGRDHGFTSRNAMLFPELAALTREQEAIDAWYVDWADAQAEEALAETIEFTLIGGNRGAMTRGEVLLHVVTHGSYHRGFVADLFAQVPRNPPTMDLPVYKRVVAEAAHGEGASRAG